MSLFFFETSISMPGKMVILPLRCTVVKTSRGVVVISPIAFTPSQIRQIQSLGPVTALVAPSLIHHLFLPQAISTFGNSEVWGPPGCQKKMPEIPWQKILTRDAWPYSGELELLIIEGMPHLSEVIFYEKASRSLITTDLVFNITQPQGWAAPLVMRLLGTYGEFAVSRLTKRFMKDRKAFEASIKKLMQWDFDQVVMGHGDIVPHGGKHLLTSALQKRGFS